MQLTHPGFIPSNNTALLEASPMLDARADAVSTRKVGEEVAAPKSISCRWYITWTEWAV